MRAEHRKEYPQTDHGQTSVRIPSAPAKHPSLLGVPRWTLRYHLNSHLEEFASLGLQSFRSVHQHDRVVGRGECSVRVFREILQ